MFAATVLLSNFVSVTNIQGVEAPTAGSWTKMAPLPTNRTGLAAAVVNDKIYAVGGFYTDANEVYDSASNAWSKAQPMPASRGGLAAASVESKIYCIGGATLGAGGPVATSKNEVFDTTTGRWTEMEPMPTPRYQISANVVDGKIYVIGGSSGIYEYKALDVNEAYDLSTNTWSKKEALPVATSNYVSAVVEGRIYIIGNELTQIYDPQTDSWSYGAAAPEVSYGAAGATTGEYASKKIYIFGGLNLFASKSNYIYNPKTDTWSSGNAMPTARGQLAVAVVKDRLYALGGTAENYVGEAVSLNEQYTPIDYGSISPEIKISSPENGKTYMTKTVPLTFEINRPISELTKLYYILDDNDPVNITGNVELPGLADGNHNLRLVAESQIYSPQIGTCTVSGSNQTQFTITTPTPTLTTSPQPTETAKSSPTETTPTPTITSTMKPSVATDNKPNSNKDMYGIFLTATVLATCLGLIMLVLKTKRKPHKP